jgi:hypothetical protein
MGNPPRADVEPSCGAVAEKLKDADGWIEWKGGDCPCGPGVVVEWKTRAMPGDQIYWGPREADLLDWRQTGGGDDIVAFRVVGAVTMHVQKPGESRRVCVHGMPEGGVCAQCFADHAVREDRRKLSGVGLYNDNGDESILAEAARIVAGDRQADYGDMRASFGRIATIWSAILDTRVSPRDVARCMIALKLSRDLHRPKRDNLVDIAGYAHCAQQLEDDVP